MKWDRAVSATVRSGGRTYTDFSSGVVLTNVGHGNAQIRRRVRKATSRPLLHCYINDFDEKIELTRRLLQFVGRRFSTVAYHATGAESVELALRVAFRTLSSHKNLKVVCFDGAFHGKTLGAAALSDISRYRLASLVKPINWIVRLPYPTDVRSSRACLQQIADLCSHGVVLVMECAQGSTLRSIHPSFASGLKRLARDDRFLLVLDEIQTGFFRAGTRFMFERLGLPPDILCLSKGLTSSLPLSATLLTPRTAKHFSLSVDSSTHSANPLSVAAALGCLDVYCSKSFTKHLSIIFPTMSQVIERLRQLAPTGIEIRYPGGLLAGIVANDGDMAKPWFDGLREYALNRHVLLPPTIGKHHEIIKLCPPLILNRRALLHVANLISEYMCSNQIKAPVEVSTRSRHKDEPS